jgi:hypothetical protein
VASAGIEVQHDCSQRLGGDRLSGRGMADLVILAVDALEVAGGKEDRACPAGSGKRRLFAVVRKHAADDHPGIQTAEPLNPCHTVHPTHPRAEDATSEDSLQGFYWADDLRMLHPKNSPICGDRNLSPKR